MKASELIKGKAYTVYVTFTYEEEFHLIYDGIATGGRHKFVTESKNFAVYYTDEEVAENVYEI